MYRVALTGGIGSGKSTVAELFARHGVLISDADAISHALTGPGGSALAAIEAAFGAELIDDTGVLDRGALRRLVFNDEDARRRLEGILHPLIRERMLAETDQAASDYALLVIPLLLETGQQSLADRVLVVDVPERLQIERVAHRSGLDSAEIRRIIASQVSRRERLAAADDVIDNSDSADKLAARVALLHRQYLALCGARRR